MFFVETTMEVPLIQSRTHMSHRMVTIKTEASNQNKSSAAVMLQPKNFTLLPENTTWSPTNIDFYNITANSSDYDYDFQTFNSSGSIETQSWALCKEWTPAQHPLFQTANFFFAAAFLVPGSFKQSVLIVRYA